MHASQRTSLKHSAAVMLKIQLRVTMIFHIFSPLFHTVLPCIEDSLYMLFSDSAILHLIQELHGAVHSSGDSVSLLNEEKANGLGLDSIHLLFSQ